MRKKNRRELPKVMVLQYQPELTHCMWADYYPRNRTLEGLIRALDKEVKKGRFAAYRLISIQRENRASVVTP